MDTDWESVVVGGGVAGLSAALVLGRARRRTLVLDQGGQSNRPAAHVGGLLAQEGTSPDELYARGREQLGLYDTVELRAAEAIDARARALEAKGDTAGARDSYREARDLDALRFRAPATINAIIREEATRHGATVVESAERLAASSPGGVVGASLMLEHLHPNLDGYAIVAGAFHEAMRASGVGGSVRGSTTAEAGTSRAHATVTPVDSMVGVLRTDRLVSGWPFRARGQERTPVVDTLTPRTQVEGLAQSVVLGRLPWTEATERLRTVAEEAGNHELAMRAASALAQEIDWSPVPCLDAARAAVAMGSDDDALAWAQCSLAR